jgi:hypothetical protein
MTTKRNFGRVVAIGSLTAAAALLTGFSVAEADEVADLRAQMELMQRRIDQLAQVPSPLMAPGQAGPTVYGTPPVPGAALVGGSFPRSFLIPGTDTSIRVGGFVDETLDYWFSGGNPNSSPQTTTLGDNGIAPTAALDVHGQIIPNAVTGVGTCAAGFTNIGAGRFGATSCSPNVQIAHSRGNAIFSQSPRESRLNVETRTPTAFGEARTFMEFDWAGSNNFAPGGNNPTSVSDNLHPRLRYAYGTLGGFLAGQANSNFSDPDANAETLDFGGNMGDPGVVRIPQVRYTISGPWGSAWSVSLETPETDVYTPVGLISTDASPPSPAGNGTALSPNPTKSPAPDVTFASYWAQPWGHVDFSAVVRDLELNDGHFISRQYIGYGGHIGFDVKPGWFGWSKDDITFHIVAGDGIGRYLNCSCNAGLATNFGAPGTLAANGTAISNAAIHATTLFAWGGNIGYQHWWLPNLRSNINGGINHVDTPSALIGPSQDIAVDKQVITAHVNLIWSPVAFIDTGIEYVYSHRVVVANLKGDQNALIGKFRVKF